MATKPWPKLRAYLLAKIEVDVLLEIELMALAMAVGINDAVTFSNYHVFMSNQTGNTVFLAIGAFGIHVENLDLTNTGLSLGFFILGGSILGQLGDLVGPQKRIWLFFTNLLQTSLVFTAAALQKWTILSVSRTPVWGLIVCLAFESGGQVAMARTLHVPEIPTAMITSAYTDLLVDPNVIHLKNRPRNRRVLFILSLFSGGCIGAAAYRYAEPAFAFLLAALLKMGVCVAFLFNSGAHGESLPKKSAVAAGPPTVESKQALEELVENNPASASGVRTSEDV